jgi:histidinol-phosphate phosphatase family protein
MIEPIKHPAIFFDRDGTLCEAMPEGEYPTRPENIRVFPFATKMISTVKAMGFQPVIVTNQSMINRGLATEEGAKLVHEEFTKQLGVNVPTFMCAHQPDDHCACRKPKPGLLFMARDAMNLDLSNSIMIGDKDADVQAGQGAGCLISYRLTVPGDYGGPGSLSYVFNELMSLWQAGLWPRRR